MKKTTYSRKESRSSGKRQRRARGKEKREVDRTIQLPLPLIELLASAQESLGRLVVDVGRYSIHSWRPRTRWMCACQ